MISGVAGTLDRLGIDSPSSYGDRSRFFACRVLIAGCKRLWLGVSSCARAALNCSYPLSLPFCHVMLFRGQTSNVSPTCRRCDRLGHAFRWSIFRDALNSFRSPWCALFLNFDISFAIFRDASLTGARAYHPIGLVCLWPKWDGPQLSGFDGLAIRFDEFFLCKG